MAPQPQPESSLLDMLRTTLLAIDGVDDVVIDDATRAILLVCANRAEGTRIRERARATLAEHGMDDEALPVTTVVRTDQLERRARFDRVERYENPDREVRVRVFLEWEATLYSGDAVGEKGAAIELRTAASAAIEALEAMTGQTLGVRLVGVKQVRAFDAELTVVSLYRTGAPSQKLLGAVLTGPDSLRAAAVAVLNALNRSLGNLLSR